MNLGFVKKKGFPNLHPKDSNPRSHSLNWAEYTQMPKLEQKAAEKRDFYVVMVVSWQGREKGKL